MAIGDQRPSRQLIQAPAPRVNADAFGAGISRGLGNIAQSLVNLEGSRFELEAQKKRTADAFKDRQQKIERSSASADLIRMRAETAREIEEMRRTWENPTGEGFTNAVNEVVVRKAQEFGSSLSEDLSVEFEPRLAEFQETFVTAGFESELKAGDGAFVKAATDITQTAMDEILLGSLSLEEAAEEIDLFLDSSPLAELETDQLAQEIFSSLQTAAFSVEAGKAAQDPLTDRGSLPAPDSSTGIFATSMSPAAAGFLGAVGSAESGNDYNVMFSPGEKRRTFSDFSKHPNSPARIPSGPNKGKVSTAAGRYQIIKPTWDRAAAALGLEDFSPANQDRAAWWIAQEAFERNSGGISLERALASGDPIQIEKVRRVLSGEADSGVVYEGLRKDKGMTRQKFYDLVTSGKATIPSVATDERFDSIPLTDKLAIFSDAVSAENTRQSELLKQRQAARSAAVNELIANINLGRAGESDILAANEQFNFGAVELDKINTAFEAAFEGQIGAQRFAARLESPAFSFDPTQAPEREAANNFANRSFAESLNARDEGTFNAEIAPFVAQTGFVPNIVEQRLTQFTRSNDPEIAGFGFKGMQTLLETNPAAFDRAFGDNGRAIVSGFIGAQLRGQPLNEFQSEVQARQLQPDFFQQVDTVLKQVRKDSPDRFTVQQIANEVGNFRFSNAELGNQAQGLSLFREYDALVRNAMVFNPDPDAAHKVAIETLQGRWGESELGDPEGYFLRRPPETIYPRVNESHKWIEQQARQELNIAADQPIRFISDGQTEAEIAQGGAPSYMIFTNENGVFAPQMVPTEDGRMLPARMNFERSTDMIEFEIDRVLLQDELHQLREEEEFIRQEALRSGAGTDEDRARIQELRDIIREKEQQVESMEKEFR